MVRDIIRKMLSDEIKEDHIWKCREIAIGLNYPSLIRRYYQFLYGKYLWKCNAGISVKAKFAGKPNFPHGLCGIFISQEAAIGKNATILQQVTIGSNTISDSKGLGAPTIGDNVYIGAGAKIIGNVHIGDNCMIGANCVVVEDVPDNSTVVLHKPRIIAHRSDRNWEILRISELNKKSEQT